MEAFEIYEVPASLTFQDYLNICQCARTLADGYDRKVGINKRQEMHPHTHNHITGQVARLRIADARRGGRRLLQGSQGVGPDLVHDGEIRRPVDGPGAPGRQGAGDAAPAGHPVLQVGDGRRNPRRVAPAGQPRPPGEGFGLFQPHVQDHRDQRRPQLDAAEICQGRRKVEDPRDQARGYLPHGRFPAGQETGRRVRPALGRGRFEMS